MPRGGRRRSLFIGGIGCLGLVLLAASILGVSLLWAGLSHRRLGAPVAASASRQIPLGAALAGGTPAMEALPIRLDLDLRQGRFTLRPGEPGSAVVVEGSFAGSYYELVDERRPREEAGEEVRIELRPRVGYLVRLLAGLNRFDDRHPNRLTITVPPDRPLDLRLRVEEGFSDIDLGGLDLTGLSVSLAKGEHALDFSRPLARDLERLDLTLEMGDGRATNLGHARPREMHVATRMGSFRVTLGGAWPPGGHSRVDVDHAMGDLTLLIPQGVRVHEDSSSTVILGGSTSRGLQEPDSRTADAPVLTISASTSMGGVSILRY